MTRLLSFILVGLLLFAFALPTLAQDLTLPQPQPQDQKSPGKALALSLLLPGLGHRYANSGWGGASTVFALVDVSLWVGLISNTWYRNQQIQTYETLAATRASALVEGKDRTFFLNLASFHSSEEYLDINLRNRNWDDLDYVSERTNQWAWQTEEDFQRYREVRENAESLKRRSTSLIALLVANRLLAGILSIGATNRANRRVLENMNLSLSPSSGRYPVVNVRVGF